MPVAAQLAVEEIPQDRVLAPRDDIDRTIAGSRFRLGPVRIAPAVEIRELTYDNNVYGTAESPKADFRAVVSAGADLILPITPNIFLRAGLFPEYTWYAEFAERRFFGGRYGASFLVFANRLTLEGSGGIAREDVVFSSEAQGRVIRDVGTVKLGAELRLLQRMFLYGEAQIQRFRFTGPGAEAAIFDPSATDRTSRQVRAELRYRWSDEVRAAVGYEETRDEFVHSPQLYDNLTRAVLGTLYYDRKGFFVRVSGGYREGEPINGSTVPPFSGGTGSGFASYAVTRWLDLRAFASRSLVYGLSSPYYLATRYGGGIGFKAGWRLEAQGYLGAGTDDYTTPFSSSGGPVDRKDDIVGYGGGFDFLVTHRVQLRFRAMDSRYNSNVAGYDRSFFRFFVTLHLWGNLLQ